MLPLFLSFHLSYDLRKSSNCTHNFRGDKRTIVQLPKIVDFEGCTCTANNINNAWALRVQLQASSLSKISVELYGSDKNFNGTIFLVLKQYFLRKNLLLLYPAMFSFAIFHRDLSKSYIYKYFYQSSNCLI